MAVVQAAGVRRSIALLLASLTACNIFIAQAALDPSIVPARFLTARSGIGTDPLFLYYFPECVAGVTTTFADSVSPSVTGTFSSPTTPTCPSNNGFTNSNNGFVVDGTPSTSLKGFKSSGQLSALTLTDFSLEMWIRTDSSLSVPGAEYILFEIGVDVPAGTGFSWACNSEYVARFSYLESTSSFLFGYKGVTGVNCFQSSVSAGFTFTPGQLYHIVISVDESSLLELIIDGVSVSTGLAMRGDMDFTSITQEFVYFGDSPAALSTSSVVNARPWDGEILLVSFYDIALSVAQAGALNTAFLPNHRPAVKTSTRTGQEDANLTIAFTNLVDYYDEDEKSSTVTTPIQFIIESTPGSGFLFDDNGIISVSGGAHTVVGTLQYGQNVPNVFNFSDSFTYSINDQIAAKTAPGTMNLFIGATNDIPVAEDVDISIPAFQINNVVFQGRDNKDCPGLTCEDGFFPQSMQVQVVGNSFGQLKRVNGGSFDCTAPLGADITNGETFALDSQGQFLACYEAAGDSTINSNGVVGVDTITYTVSDAFETSPSGTVTVTVTSVLSVANLLTHVQEEDEVVETAGNATGSSLSKPYVIDLVGVDNKCDDVDITGTIVTPKVGVLGCPRQKEYIISPPLPSFGTLLVDDDGTLKAITDADLVAEGFYLIPGNGSQVFFLPEENFFNAAPHPLCKPSLLGSDTQISRCAVAGPYSGPSCVGPFCADGTPFTTLSFNGSFGFCNKTECPPEIHYRLKIGQAISEEDTDPDIQIYVKSQFDRNPLVFEPSRSLTATGLGYPRFDTPIRTNNGDPLRLDALDQDQRIVGCQFLLAGNAVESKIRIASALLTARPEDDDFQYDGCFFQGCDSGDTSTIFTFPSRLNEVFESLDYSHVDTTANLEESVSVIIRDRYLFTAVPPDAANYLLIFVLNFSSGGGGGGNIFSDIQFIAIASSVGLLILMCLISYCGCLGARARNMTRSCLQIQSLRSHNNDVPHTAAEYRKSLRHNKDVDEAANAVINTVHKRHASEQFALSMLKVAACFCPCCCSYDAAKLKVPGEEVVEREVIYGLATKLAKPPDQDDETHRIDEEHFDEWMLVYDDDDHPFWWNQRTGKSQWYSPFPEGSHMQKVLEARFKKEGAKMHKPAKKVKKSKSKKNNRPPPGRPKGPPPKGPSKGGQPKKYSPAPPKHPKGGKKLDRMPSL